MSLPYLPFEGGRWQMRMGLQALRPEGWLEFDQALAAELDEKRALLAARRDEVFAALQDCTDAATELLAVLANHLPRYHGDIFNREGKLLLNRTTGESWDVTSPALHPLDLCGRLVQEDVCLMLPHGDRYTLAGATLCAPNRWRIADKIGRPLVAIHDVVPGYDETLARPVDRFMAQVAPGKLVWRVNWGIADRADRFQPVALPRSFAITAENAGHCLFLRIERQTLHKLPESAAVVFTIRTYIEELGSAIATRAAAEHLAGSIRTMPEAMRRYKALAPFAEELLLWLEARARALTA